MKQHVSERTTKVVRAGAVDGYQITGWRYREEAVWHVKVWVDGNPGAWMGYAVTEGEFALKGGPKTHKEAILRVVRKWDAETTASSSLCLTVTR
jgi:hypothetical protein